MHRKLSWLLVVGFALALILSLAQSPAEAIPPFQKEFVKMYAPPGSPLAAKVKKVKCNICHKGKKKKNRNAYGEALAKLLDRKKDKKNVEKIRKALKTVESQSAKPGGPTFGELLKAGKLPAEE